MNDQDTQGQEVEQEGTDYETAAREMGWVDKDAWEGEEGKWTDAKTFVERGEHIMPILRANNKRLKQDLLTRDKEIATLKSSVDAATKAIKALQKHYTEATEKAVDQAKKDLREQLKQARELGDVDAELEAQDKLSELRTASKEVEGQVKEPEPTTPALTPEFVEWQKENPWFGGDAPVDRKRTKSLTRIAEDLREEGDDTVGRAFMDKCMKILEKQEGTTTRSNSKVEGGGPGARTSGGGRAFDNLPKEAKAICHEDNDNFVGPGKMFKTVKEWEDHYANMYNQE